MGRGSSKVGGGASSAVAGGGSNTANISAPADIDRFVTPLQANQYMKSHGLSYVSHQEMYGIRPGTQVVVSEPIVRSSLSSRRDPDGIHYEVATFESISNDAFQLPTVRYSNGRRSKVDIHMPYESIYVKR